jgi:hypothetical protein
VVMKSSISWGIMKVNWSFGGTFCLHFQSQRISHARYYHEAGSNQSCLLSASYLFLVLLILWPWGLRRHLPPKHRLTFNGLHGIISQKIELFYIYNFKTEVYYLI